MDCRILSRRYAPACEVVNTLYIFIQVEVQYDRGFRNVCSIFHLGTPCFMTFHCQAKFREEKRKSRESKASAEAAKLDSQESGPAEAKTEADPQDPQDPQEQWKLRNHAASNLKIFLGQKGMTELYCLSDK